MVHLPEVHDYRMCCYRRIEIYFLITDNQSNNYVTNKKQHAQNFQEKINKLNGRQRAGK